MTHRFSDTLTISGTKIRQSDGALLCDAKVARTGVQLYTGAEVGKPDLPVVRVYRDPVEVFSDATMESFAHRPVTNDHPKAGVSAENWKKTAVGNTTGDVAQTGRFLRVPLMVSDAASIADVQNGKRELSAGYVCDLNWTAGTSPDGEAYDARQVAIRGNHIAIVQSGRAGQECRIGDGAVNWGPSPITTADKKDTPMTLRKITVDGLSVETTDAGVQAIEKLQADVSAGVKALADAKSGFAAKMSEKDKEDAKKDAEIKELKDAALTPDAVHAMVADLAKLTADAKAVAPDVKTDGLTADAIRKAVVVASLGDDAIKDKSDDYITARYDGLVDSAQTQTIDGFRTAIQGGLKPVTNDAWDDSVFAAAGMKVGA